MADPKQKGENAAKGGEASPSQWAGLGFAGLWLMALICISVFISVVVFGATQFQTRFASLSFGGGPLTIWKAEQLRTEWIASLANLAAASKSLNADRTALEAANEKGLAASAQAAEAANNANALHKQLLDKVRIPYPDTAANTSLTTLISLLEKQQPVAEADRQLARSASDAEELARKSFAEAVAANNRTNALQASITKKNDELKSAQGFAGSLLTSKNNVELPDDQRIQIENAIYEFNALQGFSRGIVYVFALAPSDILVLLLVIAMGVLGSSLSLSHIYITEFAQRPASFYIFRPFLGIVTAVVIFIVAKAGVPVITDTSRFGGNAPINPYFISFLAIISGFLSEQALEMIKRVGSSYFQEPNAGEPARWARTGLRDHFTQANRDPASLAPTFNADVDQISDWVDGKKAIPAEVQKLIAAILNIPRRDLFTDIAPDAT